MDDFRTLQRKFLSAWQNTFSSSVLSTKQINIAYLKPFQRSDPIWIAFYRLVVRSEKSGHAYRPCSRPEYCLSICSADFNDGVWKNAFNPITVQATSERALRDIELWPGQEIHYSEMAALIAPRPFIWFERGHFGRVRTDDRVAKEFA